MKGGQKRFYLQNKDNRAKGLLERIKEANNPINEKSIQDLYNNENYNAPYAKLVYEYIINDDDDANDELKALKLANKIHGDLENQKENIQKAIENSNKKAPITKQNVEPITEQKDGPQPVNSSSSSSKTTVDELLVMIKKVHEEMKPLVKDSTETVSKIQTYIANLTEKFKLGTVDQQQIINELTKQNKDLTDEKTTLLTQINELNELTTNTTSKIAEKENQITQLKQTFESERKELKEQVKQQQETNQIMLEDKGTTLQRHAEKIEEKRKDIDKLRIEKQELKEQLQKQNDQLTKLNKDLINVEAIEKVITQIKEKTQTLVENNNKIDEIIKQDGGYQYKSKNKSRSRRKYKGNRFGLLKSKSKSKTRKGKKKKKKKNKNIKGGMKTRTKSKRKSKKGKKTRKGKKKNNKRK